MEEALDESSTVIGPRPYRTAPGEASGKVPSTAHPQQPRTPSGIASGRPGLVGSAAVLGSLFVQTVFWRALAYLSWALVSLLTIRVFESVELFGLISAALLVLGSLPALDGGFRNTLNRRILGRPRDGETLRTLRFGQRLYTRFCAAVLVAGTLILCAYSFTPNARSLELPWAFYPSLGAVGGIVALGSAFLQLLTGLGQQRRMFMLQLFMAWASIGILWAGFRLGLGVWSFVLSQSLPSLVAMGLAAPGIREAAPGLRLLDFAWDRDDTARLKELWPDSSGLMRFQLWTLLVYTLDATLVAWLWQGKLVGQYLLVANLFSKLRLLLQSADDAVWPILAAKTDKAETIAEGVLRFNGWLWGGAMAVSALCIPAFIADYKAQDFSGGTLLTALFALRYLVMGIASQPGYWMFGHGHMELLARLMRRELLCCLALSLPLGLWLGPIGILIAFIAGSSGSTLLPLHLEFARASGRSAWPMLRSSWSRAALAAAVAGGSATVGLRLGGHDWRLTVVVAGVCLAATLALALGMALLRARRAGVTGRAELGRFL